MSICGLAVAFGDFGYRMLSAVDPMAMSNPLRTNVLPVAGAWLSNYASWPLTMLAPVAGFGSIAIALTGILGRRDGLAFGGSALSIAGIVATVGVSMFPFILPSSIDAHSSLTVWNASSSARTFGLMLIVTVVFLPLILVYTGWALRVMRGRLTTAEMATRLDIY